jgi:hypothetical protein
MSRAAKLDPDTLLAEVEHLMQWRGLRDGRVLAARLGYTETVSFYRRLRRHGAQDEAQLLADTARQNRDDEQAHAMPERRTP